MNSIYEFLGFLNTFGILDSDFKSFHFSSRRLNYYLFLCEKFVYNRARLQRLQSTYEHMLSSIERQRNSFLFSLDWLKFSWQTKFYFIKLHRANKILSIIWIYCLMILCNLPTRKEKKPLIK